MVGVLVLIFKLFIAFEKVSLDWKAVNNTPLFKKMREPEFRKLTDKSVITGKMLDAIMKYYTGTRGGNGQSQTGL